MPFYRPTQEQDETLNKLFEQKGLLRPRMLVSRKVFDQIKKLLARKNDIKTSP